MDGAAAARRAAGAGGARFWIGTSGWNYYHWRERFYPKGLPQREWFRYYAGRFATVEINATFYREPKDSAWDAWRNAAPPGFRFAVKAHRYLTHRAQLRAPEDALERVLSGARRLGPHLGPVLYQLPPSFKRGDDEVERLERFLALLPGDVRHAVEFRDASWHGEETYELLRRYGVAYCWLDRGGEGPPLWPTARFGYMRFHGSSARYAGNYTDEMLSGWAQRLREASAGLEEVWVYFNNDWQAFAVANALKLAELLGVSTAGATAAR
jgi:uncharacterized protein YecE (DUF72 family)